MNPKMSKTNIPKENPEKKEQLKPIADYSRTNLSAEVVPVTENKEKVSLTKNLRTIDKGNLLGGAPGRNSTTPNPERTRKAVREIHAKHPEIEKVITFETPGDYKGDPASINAEKEEWAKLGVKVIELRTEETDLLEFFQNTENHKAIIEAFKALDKGTAFIHCTFGMHRAVAFTEIWRATRGINRSAAMEANKDYNSSRGHRECREQAQKIIGILYESNKKKASKLETKDVAPGDPLQIKNKYLSRNSLKPENYFVSNLTEIEGFSGSNYRGGAPGRLRVKDPVTGKGKNIYDKKRIEAAVARMIKEKKIHTVIIMSGTKLERDAWKKHGVKVIYMPNGSLQNIMTKYTKEMWEAFEALNKPGGGAFVHCTYGSHRAFGFVEMWRASRGNLGCEARLDAHKSYKGHEDVRDNANKWIRQIRRLKGVETTQQAPLTLEETAKKITLIGDSIGAGISDSGIKRYFGKYKRFASGGRVTVSRTQKNSIDKQLERVDPTESPYLVIQGGTNDLNRSAKTTPEMVAQRLKNLYSRAKERGFEKVFIVTIPSNTDENMRSDYKKAQLGTKALQTNELLRQMASKGEIELFDLDTKYKEIDPNLDRMAPDGVHFKSKGSEDLARLILTEMRDRVNRSHRTTGDLAGDVGTTLSTEGQVVPIPGYVESISAFTTTEHQSPESQKLQETLQKELEKISPTMRAKDLEKIKNSTIKDLRFNVGLLNGNKEKVPEEMNRRLAQYTDTQSDGGLRINYLKFNELTGQNHEMGIGLGDIMPPRYTKILIITEDGRQRLGERGIVGTSSGPRVGYRDTETGGYLATYTGDIVYVLDPPLTDEAKLKELLAQEASTRSTGESSYDSYEATSPSRGYDLPPETYSGEEYEKTGGMQENPKLKRDAIRGLDRNIKRNGKFWNYEGVKISIPINGKQTVFWEYNSSLSEGENIYNYSKAVCKAHGMGNMISAVWGIVKAESTFNPFLKNTGSQATGLGQPMHKTWRSFIPRALSSNDPFIRTMIKGQKNKGIEYPNNKGRVQVDLSQYAFEGKKAVLNYSRCNPYINIYSVIMGIKRNKEKYEIYHRKHGVGVKDFSALSTPDQLRLLYLSHHDGGAGGPAQLAFMIHLQKDLGIDITNRALVRRFCASGSPESKKAQKLLCGNQGRRIYRRAVSGEDSFLRSWYKTCSTVVRAALGINYKRTSLPDLDGVRRSSSPSSGPETASTFTPTTHQIQQPARISKNTPQIRIPTIDKRKFPGKTAILVLGNGPNPARNKYRAQVGAEISFKMREVGIRPQLIFSGGTKSRKVSEAQEQIDYLASDPRYLPLLEEKDNPVGRERLSQNTWQNISNTIGHLRKKGFQNVIVVSSEPGENHGRRGAGNLRRRDKSTMNITYWEPETPDLNNNFIGPTNFAQPTEPSEPVREVKSSAEKEETTEEKLKLSTTDLIKIFKSGDKEKIDKIIAQHGYPSLEKIEKQLKGIPQGKFEEEPEGVAKRIEKNENKVLLTFDICSNYSKDKEKNVLNFINNVMSKKPPVPVVLFVTGNALSNPRIRTALKEAAKYPHISIQNHGFRHLPIGTASGSKAEWGLKPTQNTKDAYYEMVKGAILTESITGTKPKVFRAAGLYGDTRGVKMANLLGFQVLGQTHQADYQDPGEEKVGDIVLRHANKSRSQKFIDNVRLRMEKGEIAPTLNPKFS
jgi:lysophospholipase L1-like esterase